MKKLGRRMVARLMAGVLTVSLGPVPASTVRAEEIRSEDVIEVITVDNGEGVSEDEKTDALRDEAASVSGNEAIGEKEKEEDNEPEDENAKEKPDDGSGHAGDQKETSEGNATEGEMSEEIEEDLREKLAEDAEDIEEGVGTDEADAVREGRFNSAFGIYASGVVDEEYGHIEWAIDTQGGFRVTGTGDFAGPKGNAYSRLAPWYNYARAIDTAEIDVTGMKDASYMFNDCYNLKSVDMSNFDTSQITDISYMFADCRGLTGLDLSSLDTGKVTRMGGVFSGCSNLAGLDLSSFHTGNVTDMTGMFSGCSSLKRLDISDFDLASLENGSDFFEGCLNLLTINTPRNLKSVIGLPDVTADGDGWYLPDGSRIKSLPTNRSDSVKICRSMEDIASGRYENLEWGIDIDGKLTVSGRGNFASEVGKDAPWREFANEILSAEVKVTGMTNASHMFDGCNDMTNVDMSHFDTSQITDMDDMFRGCSSLTSLDLSSFDTGKVTSMRDMFFSCGSLTSLDLSNFDIGNVINMSSMFRDCSSLTSLDLSNFNTSKVKTMAYMFSDCSSLTSLDLSNFNTGEVTWMDNMFSNCNSLTSLDLRSFDTREVVSISEMFSGCIRISRLDLSNFDMVNLSDSISVYKVLEGCNNLTTIYAPRNLGYPIKLPKIPFRDVWYLPDGSVTEYLSYNIKSIVVCKNKLQDDQIAGGKYEGIVWFIDANGKLTVSGTGNYVSDDEKDIVNRAPWSDYSDDIVSAEISVVGMTGASYMFERCYNLESVDLSNFDTSSVTDMSGMFSDCDNLMGLDLSNFDTSSVTDMSGMFRGCGNLTDLDLSNFDTSSVTDMSGMFCECYSLSGLDISNFDTSSVTNMLKMFCQCYKLTGLDISNFDTRNVTNMSEMFFGCSELADLNFGNFDTSQVKNMAEMFSYCENLASLDLSSFDLGSLKAQDNDGYDIWHLSIERCGLNTVYTPRNLPVDVSVSLPDGTWYQPDGTIITELPHLDHSIIITKDKVPSVADPHITAVKRKTVYKCGDRLDINDLTVRYYDSDGKVIYVTDYTTNADQIDMSTPGTKSLVVTYNGLTATVELTVSGTSDAKERVEISGLQVQDSIYSGRAIAYGGTASVRTSAETDVTDKVTLIYTYSGKMADGSSYPASSNAPANAGQYTLKVSISGEDSNYTGSVEYPFAIHPAPVVISVPDCIYTVGEVQTVPDSYEFEITGLLNGDKLTKQPGFTFTDMDGKEISKGSIDLSREGNYYIVPVDADAGINYEIIYRKGTFSVTAERVAYTVRFELNGHADEISPITGVKAGSLIDAPENPTDDGYIFKGWYKESACRNMWDFAKDVVQEDVTLYACWITAVSPGTKGTDLCIQEIQDMFYTGSALKPGISVYSGDGETLLKSGRDYTIKYCNNVDADTIGEAELGGTSATGQEGDNGFTKNLAYALIMGKGNYTGTVYQNFHINAVPISAEDREGGQTPAQGFTLKYTEQMTVNGSKVQKPFTSLRYKKVMKAGKDYEVMLRAVDACDEKETVLEKDCIISRSDSAGTLPAIPKGYRGTFLMTVTGMGNYTGSIQKTIYVADNKAYLMKNAVVTLGKNQKVIKNPSAADLKRGIILTPAYYDASDKKYYTVGEDGTVSKEAEPDGSNVFTVKSGKTYLVYEKDYTVKYEGNKAAGNAVMTLTGKGKYAGTKDIKFKIAGIPFNTKNILLDSASFQSAMPYSGKALTQNKVVLYPKGGSVADALVYGVDYTISYKNNISKGTATMTFSAKSDSGYSGSFRKTYKITGSELAELTSVSVKQGTGDNRVIYEDSGAVRLEKPVLYTREGVKPAGQLCLMNRETGAVLKEGRDYKVSYKNNSAVTAGKVIAADKKPVVVIAGKGSYTGTLSVYFEIGYGRIVPQDIAVSTMALNMKNNYQYMPKVKIMDGRKALRSGADKDYVVTYRNNDQANVTRYINGEADAKEPEAVISVPPASSYHLTNAAGETVPEIRVPLKLYRQALKKNELFVIVDEPVYNGCQLKPQGDSVRVYLGNSKSVKAAYQSKEKQDTVLTAQEGQYRLVRLTEGTDYILGYGANIAAGTNKGSLTIAGNSSQYGGSVTIKFTILRRDVYRNQ